MKHTRCLAQMIGLTLVVLLLAACGGPEPTATPIPPTPTPRAADSYAIAAHANSCAAY